MRNMLTLSRSSYSLPGHLTITMPSLPSGYEGKLRELRELKLVFESKSEYLDDQGESHSVSEVYGVELTEQADTPHLESSSRHWI